MDLPFAYDALSGLHRDELSEERRQLLAETADDLLDRAIVEHDDFHAGKSTCDKWRHLKTKKASSIYIDNDSCCAKPTRRVFLASGIVPGSASEVMRGVYADSTEVHRITNTIIYPRTLLDSSVVHVYQKYDPESPVLFEAITWMALQLPFLPLTAPREVVTYERLGVVYNAAQERLTYRIVLPINVAETRDRNSRMLKADYTSVNLYRDITKGCVGVFNLIHTRVHRFLTSVVSDQILKICVSAVASCVQAARAKALSALMLEAAERKASLSVACDLCGLQPPLFSKLVRCAGCHKQVCKRCRQKHVIFQLRLKHRRPEKEMFCKDCLIGVQLHHQGGDLAKSFALYFESSSSSDIETMKEGYVSSTLSEASPSEESFHNFFGRYTRASSCDHFRSSNDQRQTVASASEKMHDSDVSETLADLLHQACAPEDKNVVWNEEERQRFSLQTINLSASRGNSDEHGQQLKWGSLDIRLLD